MEYLPESEEVGLEGEVLSEGFINALLDNNFRIPENDAIFENLYKDNFEKVIDRGMRFWNGSPRTIYRFKR